MVAPINESDMVSLETFKRFDLTKYFVIDTSGVYVNGRSNADHMYKLFSEISGHSSSMLRMVVWQSIAADVEFYSKRGLFVCQCIVRASMTG